MSAARPGNPPAAVPIDAAHPPIACDFIVPFSAAMAANRQRPATSWRVQYGANLSGLATLTTSGANRKCPSLTCEIEYNLIGEHHSRERAVMITTVPAMPPNLVNLSNTSASGGRPA